MTLVSLDRKRLRRLTTTRGTHDTLGEETMRTWSPDGRTAVFVSNRDGNFELYAISDPGQEPEQAPHRVACLAERLELYLQLRPGAGQSRGRVAELLAGGCRTVEVRLDTAGDLGDPARLSAERATSPLQRPPQRDRAEDGERRATHEPDDENEDSDQNGQGVLP